RVAAVLLHARSTGRADDEGPDEHRGAAAARCAGGLGSHRGDARAVGVARRRAALRGGGHVSRYLTVFGVQLRTSIAQAMAYRANFLIEGVMSVAWLGLTILPLMVLFDARESVAGWDRASALVVMAYFLTIKGIMEGWVSPSLIQLVDKIRTGAFD